MSRSSRLDIVVEGMGRINFGRAIKDFKGLTGDVIIMANVDGDDVTWKLNDWTMRTLPDSYDHALRAFTRCKDGASMGLKLDSRAGYYRGFFNLKKTGDTFINMETWGKGRHRPLLEHRPATNSLRTGMLAEERTQRDSGARRDRTVQA